MIGLHKIEKKVLLTLKEIGDGITFNILKEKSGLNEDEINRALEWLKEKKIIKIIEEVKQRFRLTKIGEKYSKIGMPEKSFLNVIKKGPLSFNDVKKKAKLDNNEFNAVIGFLKKEGLIKISGNFVAITELGIKRLKMPWKEDELLPMLLDWTFIDEIPLYLREPIPFLKSRNIIEESEYLIKNIFLTEKGKKIIPKIKLEDEIELVTPKVIINKIWKKKKFKKYDIFAPGPKIKIGKKQPYLRFVDEIKKKLISLGFEEMKGPIVELAFFNNDLLFMPQDHPAREIHDIYFIDEYGDLKKYRNLLEKIEKVHEDGWETGSKGWKYPFDKKKSAQILLRSHTTSVSIRKIISGIKIPGKYFTIDRCYRPDVVDWKHLTEFDQVEGIIVDENITFRNLLGILKMFAVEIGGVKKFKFVPGYFPFTEPSVELHVYTKESGWFEIGGAGIFRPEVTLPLGVEVPVIAWGLGILRLFMTKYKINDMRYVFSKDLRWLRNFRWENAKN